MKKKIIALGAFLIAQNMNVFCCDSASSTAILKSPAPISRKIYLQSDITEALKALRNDRQATETCAEAANSAETADFTIVEVVSLPGSPSTVSQLSVDRMSPLELPISVVNFYRKKQGCLVRN